MRDGVDNTTNYASFWLPKGFKEKNISSFGKTVFQNIIRDTVEHNRKRIIERINRFDDIAKEESAAMKRMVLMLMPPSKLYSAGNLTTYIWVRQ